MPIRLPSGQYWGEVVRSRVEDGLRLTLCRYEPNRAWPEHVHENPGVMLLVGGHHLEQTRKDEIVQPQGSLLYHPCTAAHATRSGPDGMLVLNISFSTSWLHSLGMEENDCGSDRVVWDDHTSRQLAMTMLATLYRPSTGSCPSLRTCAMDLLGPLGSSREDRIPRWLAKVKSQLDERFPEDVGVTELAEAVSYHPVYVCRTFKKHFGVTITEYLLGRRLDEAVRLISKGVRAGAAATRAGFYDQSHLNRVCRSRLHTTPHAFANPGITGSGRTSESYWLDS